jgi:hypothetical protein
MGQPVPVRPPAPTLDQLVDEALAAVEAAVRDIQGDFPGTGDHDAYHTAAASIAQLYPPQVGREVKRRLGL